MVFKLCRSSARLLGCWMGQKIKYFHMEDPSLVPRQRWHYNLMVKRKVEWVARFGFDSCSLAIYCILLCISFPNLIQHWFFHKHNHDSHFLLVQTTSFFYLFTWNTTKKVNCMHLQGKDSRLILSSSTAYRFRVVRAIWFGRYSWRSMHHILSHFISFTQYVDIKAWCLCIIQLLLLTEEISNDRPCLVVLLLLGFHRMPTLTNAQAHHCPVTALNYFWTSSPQPFTGSICPLSPRRPIGCIGAQIRQEVQLTAHQSVNKWCVLGHLTGLMVDMNAAVMVIYGIITL